MGSALHVSLPSGLKSGQHIKVKITYKTTKDCTALQWLDKGYATSVQLRGFEANLGDEGKHKENSSHTSSANANRSMPVL